MCWLIVGKLCCSLVMLVGWLVGFSIVGCVDWLCCRLVLLVLLARYVGWCVSCDVGWCY